MMFGLWFFCIAANVCFIHILIHSFKNIKNVVKLFLEIIKDHYFVPKTIYCLVGIIYYSNLVLKISPYICSTHTGSYMYIEASAPRRPGQKARLFSPGNLPTTGTCVTFFYHMYGNTMGTLNVYAKVGGALGTPILTTSGNHGNKWLQAQVTVTSASSWSVSNAEILHALLDVLSIIC